MMASTTHTEWIEEQAALLALGALSAVEAGQFHQRLASGCPVCQAAFAACEQAVAALPFAAGEVRPPASLRLRLMEWVSASQQEAPIKVPGLSAGILVRAADSPWQHAEAPGVQFRQLLGENTLLVRMAPKTWYPRHDHPLAEQCLVLEGSIESEGVTAHAGDFTYMPAGSSHAPLYTEDGCLLLIAYS
jgi:anti-sigma factor ChrR (cupin superfamily)